MAASDPLTGRTLGDFVVRHRIGEGGFGVVYRADQRLLGREAVIKVLQGDHRDSKTLIQRFLREARLASSLDHPYAAHIYAFGVEADGLMWIAMEYVKGRSLSDILRARGALPLEELVPLLDRLCEVLQAAHDLGIVHRDIKPSNVMVVQRSGRVFPKLLDFGIAKLVGDPSIAPELPGEEHPSTPTLVDRPSMSPTIDGRAAATPVTIQKPASPFDPSLVQRSEHNDAPTESFAENLGGALGVAVRPSDAGRMTLDAAQLDAAKDDVLTEAGAAVGSPPYMAPELWDDSAAATTRSDLYALGVMTYECLVGRRPFSAPTSAELARAHCFAPVPPLGGTLPAALDGVMRKVLAKQAGDRYASAMELARAVRDAAGFGNQPLPTLDDDLRVSVEASFPQPIAEAVAAFHAGRNAHQARDALRDIATTAIRYVALTALAAQAQVHVAEPGGSSAITELLRDLHRRGLSDEDWVRLGRELVADFQAQPRIHPMPELVPVLMASTSGPLAALAQPKHADADPLATIRDLLPEVTRLLRSLTFLADYRLVVLDCGLPESWMGVRKPRRIALEIHGRTIEGGQPVLVDLGGRPVIHLWPLVQTSSPMPGAPAELFLLDGRGRRGARMVAMPNMLERQDEQVWQWMTERFAHHDRDTPPASTQTARPYLGLSAFTSQDAGAFVGREREVDAAINRLNTSAFVAVVGPSGAGKSSFVHAGVLPSLAEGWTTLSVRPGASPIAALELRLRRAGFEIPDLATALARDPGVLGALFDARDTTTVLVIDQFEELFTLGAAADERTAYVQGLLAGVHSPEAKLRVVVTLRDDFLGRATQMPELRERLPAALFVLGTPARADLVRILTQPLAKLGFDFDDPMLPERMVDDVAATPGALALLSFTAAKLWELRDRHFHQLTRNAYDALGGVSGALAQHAETTLAELSSNEQRLARTALGHLVTADGTRATLTRGELAQLLREPIAGAVVEKLVAARLLVTTESDDGDDRVEIIHEALLVAWPRLAEWRREDAEGARLRDQVRAAARQWLERDRPRGLLWRDDALAELKVWRTRHPQPLTDGEQAFVAASLAEATRGRRLRRGVIGLVLGLMSIAVAVLLWARSNAEATAARDRTRVVHELLERGRQGVLAGTTAEARDAFAEARRLGAADTAALRFLEAMAAQPIRGREGTLRGHRAVVNHVEFSPDGTRVLTSSADGTARLWDVVSTRELATLRGCASSLLGASFDPLGRRIETECDDGVVRIYAADGHLEHELATSRQSSDQDRYAFARFSSDATRIGTSHHGVVEVWDVVTGKRLWGTRSSAPQGRIELSPDGSLVASMSTTEPAITLWDSATGAPVRVLKLLETNWEPLFVGNSGLAFDPSGTRLLTVASRTEVVQVWDVASGTPLQQLEGRAGPIVQLRVANDRRVAIATRDHVIQIWSLEAAKLEHTLHIGANQQVLELRFSPNSALLGATMTDGSAVIWNVTSGTRLAQLQGHEGAVWAIDFDRATERAVTGGADATAIVWTVKSAATTDVRVPDAVANDLDIRGGRMLVATDYATVSNLADDTVVARRRIGANGDARFVDDDDVAILDGDGTLWLWNVRSGNAQEIARHHHAGDWIASDGRDRFASWAGSEVIVADARHRDEVLRWNAPADVTAVALLPDRRVAIGDVAGDIHLVGASGVVEASWHVGGRVHQLQALADGRLISASPYVVQLWSPRGQLLHGFVHSTGRVLQVVDHAGGRMASTGLDGIVRIWDLATYRQLAELPHTSFADSLAFSSDDQLLATLNDEGVVSVWDVISGQQLFHFAALHGRGLVGFVDHAIAIVGVSVIVVIRF